MALTDIPFQSVRSNLYSSQELTAGFRVDDPNSYAEMLDFQIYRYFMANGGATPTDPLASMLEALHDNCITQGTTAILKNASRVAAIMGGHKLERGLPTYRNVVAISRALAKQGFLMASGGGPGAMEATHLGALTCNVDDAEVQNAIAKLSHGTAALPKVDELVKAGGTVDYGKARLLHAWYRPAIEIRDGIKEPGKSLAVPTWHYGHEPFSPLATHVAKYFQNSIREDGLLALALDGVVFVEGRAGTIQEVFQDAAQNYYKTFKRFSPMVFLGRNFWTNEYPVYPLLQCLFEKNGKGEDFKTQVLFTDDVDEVSEFLIKHANQVRGGS